MAGVDINEAAVSLSAYLASKNLPPTQIWTANFMLSVRPNTPVAGLRKTALFRILASDLTTSIEVARTLCLPHDVANASTMERTVRGPIVVQVCDVEDIGRSRWSQVEAIEAQERGETAKGREVIRVVPDDTNTDPTPVEARSSGPHKILVQDSKGTRAYAIELAPVRGINGGMSIGSKILLRDVVVARGVLLLENRNVELLGGRVEAWDKKWREERKQVLKDKAGVQGIR